MCFRVLVLYQYRLLPVWYRVFKKSKKKCPTTPSPTPELAPCFKHALGTPQIFLRSNCA